MIVGLSTESREQVDDLADKALAAGGEAMGWQRVWSILATALLLLALVASTAFGAPRFLDGSASGQGGA